MSISNVRAFVVGKGFQPDPGESIPNRGMSSSIEAYARHGSGIRLVQDRGQWFVDVRRSGTLEWLNLFEAVKTVEPKFVAQHGSLAEAERVLADYWAELMSFLAIRRG